MKSERPARSPKAGGVKVVLVVLLTAAGGGGLWLRSLDAEPVVAIPPVVTRPTPNGFDLYVRAAAALKRSRPALDELFDDAAGNGNDAVSMRFGPEPRAAWLQTNARAWMLFREAQSVPCMHPDTRPVPNPLAYTPLMNLGRAKAAEVDAFKQRGEWDEAAATGLDAIQMGIDVPRGGGYASKQLGSWIVATEIRRLDGVPQQLTSQQARAAAARLERLMARRVTGAEAMREEKWVQLENLLHWMRQATWRGEPISRETWARPEVWARQFVSKRALARSLTTEIDDSIEDMQKPYSVALPPRARNKILADFLNVGWFQPASLRFNEASAMTRLNLLQLQLALRAYQADRGRFPRTLDELSPDYLKSVPCDVFSDGAPFHYQPSTGGYLLWSVGPDTKNDEARPIAETQEGDSVAVVLADSPGDWVAGKNF